MGKFISPFIIVLLAITAVTLGYTIFQSTSKKTPPVQKTSGETQKQPSTSEKIYTFQDENSLLDYISTIKNPTPDQTRNYFQALDRLAKIGETMTINSCKSSPIALRVGLGKKFNIVNSDQVEHTIKFSKKLFTLSAGQKFTLATDDMDIGSHAYLCDGQSSGIIFVTEN